MLKTRDKETIDSPHSKTYSGECNLHDDTAIGIFTVFGIILLLWGNFWWQSFGIAQHSRDIKVRFPEVAGLREGAPVQVDGMKVGIVKKLIWRGAGDVVASLRINKGEVELPAGSKFRILSNGVIGAKYVEIVIPEFFREGDLLKDESEVEGEPPIRPELAVNKLAVGLSEIDPKKLVENYRADRIRIIRAADQLAILAEHSLPAIDKAIELENEMIPLTKSLNEVTSELQKIADKTNSSEIQKTIRLAKSTLDSANQVIGEVKSLVKDEELREDLKTTVANLNQSSSDIKIAIEKAEKIVEDKELKQSALQILNKTDKVLNKANDLLEKPVVNSNIKETIANVDEAVENIDLAARQINNILDKRFPLIHMMIGRPGHIEEKKKSE